MEGMYRHFKGNMYEVLFLAKESGSWQDVVVYQAQYGDKIISVRPLIEFNDHVERDGKIMKRFEKIGDDND